MWQCLAFLRSRRKPKIIKIRWLLAEQINLIYISFSGNVDIRIYIYFLAYNKNVEDNITQTHTNKADSVRQKKSKVDISFDLLVLINIYSTYTIDFH